MYELGTAHTKLWRSGKNEWFGDTPGFYWGDNNAKDLTIRTEYLPDPQGRPEYVPYVPQPRCRQAPMALFTARLSAALSQLADPDPPVGAAFYRMAYPWRPLSPAEAEAEQRQRLQSLGHQIAHLGCAIAHLARREALHLLTGDLDDGSFDGLGRGSLA